MPQAICRCGQALTLPTDPEARVVCPRCGARVRIRVRSRAEWPADGFIRFLCDCGRRLKVPARNRPSHGQCPDCGKILPIPEPSESTALPPGHPETPTSELGPDDRAQLEAWINRHRDSPAPMTSDPRALHTTALPAGRPPAQVIAPAGDPDTTVSGIGGSPKVEAGLRSCPRCGRPVHLKAEVCRECGTPVPRR